MQTIADKDDYLNKSDKEIKDMNIDEIIKILRQKDSSPEDKE
jgi:hypothetical protein